MLPPAVVEQQAKLGVSAEESKAQRLKRQQARFRDRGGAFVPSNSNPLIDVLLARTVSGESPSKAHPKDVTAKRLSPSKARRTSPLRKAGAATAPDESRAVAESSKSKLPGSRKRKEKVMEVEADATTKPTPKRRGRPAKGKKKVPDSDTEQPLPNTRSKPPLKGKRIQRDAGTVPSTSGGNPKPKAKAKLYPAKAVVDVLVSDDDRTLVEVPHKSTSNPRRNIRCEDDGETDDDAPIVRKLVLPPTDDSQASNTKTSRVKAEKITGAGGSGKKREGGGAAVQGEKRPKITAKRRMVPRSDDDDDDATAPVVKKGKTANSTSAKPKNATQPEPAPRTTKDVKIQENSAVTGNGKGKSRAEPDQIITKPVEDEDERPPECTPKPKKRKKAEDNHDDRPRKAVKFSDTGPPHSSSQKLKENQSDRKRKGIAKSKVKDEPDTPPSELAAKPPSRAKRSKGPPREVLERIKASAARHLQCADSEPDELDCLS